MSVRFAALVLTASPPGVSSESIGWSVKIDGRESLLRSVDLFVNREPIAQVIAVFQPASLEEGKRKYGAHFGFAGVKVAGGGPSWIEQMAAALPMLSDEVTHVIVHDAARPAVPYTDLEAILEAAEKHEAIALTAAITTPLVELDDAGQPVGYRPANEFVQLLTPQVYAKALLIKSMASKALPHASQLHCLPGSSLNIRVGSAGDAGLAKAMIGQLPKPKMKAANNPFDEAQW